MIRHYWKSISVHTTSPDQSNRLIRISYWGYKPPRVPWLLQKGNRQTNIKPSHPATRSLFPAPFSLRSGDGRAFGNCKQSPNRRAVLGRQCLTAPRPMVAWYSLVAPRGVEACFLNTSPRAWPLHTDGVAQGCFVHGDPYTSRAGKCVWTSR